MSGERLKDTNPMRTIKLGKVTVNIGVGKSGEQLEKARKVLEQITGRKPCSRRAKKTIKDFGVRKGEPIACMVTLRGGEAFERLKAYLSAVGNRVRSSAFDDYGNFSFGIKEHIEIPGTKYYPELGIFGMNVSVSLERPGYRVKRRTIKRSDISRSHLVTRGEAIEYAKQNLGIEILGEQEPE
ncbi:MAG: 50S ribosomal protein L5 [Candidatus Bathyarchaeia archaeon]